MEQPQQRRTLFEPEPSALVQPAPERIIVPPIVPPVAQPVVERELPPPAEIPEPVDVEKARFNPWLAGLWVLGVISVVASFLANWALFEQASGIDGDLSENYYVYVSIVQTFAPWIFGVGLSAIAGAVLLHALDWQRRHP
jgi:hypothetical protein